MDLLMAPAAIVVTAAFAGWLIRDYFMGGH